jgi:hypothetical protein
LTFALGGETGGNKQPGQDKNAIREQDRPFEHLYRLPQMDQ